jgi:ADP-ribose pyrophosphatase YjhB (NUDIX family)
VGGHQIEGETPEQTLVRELAEELGIVSVEHRLLAVVPEPNPEIYGEGSYHVYLVTKWNGMPRNLREDEHSELAWVRLDDVARLELAFPRYVTLFRSIRRVG